MKYFLATLFLFTCSCAMFGRNEVAEVVPFVDPAPVRYSDAPQVSSGSERKYKKYTRSEMEEDSELHAQAGSMWVNEGQGAYLFAQNKARKEGDFLNVKLEGAALKQVETKVSVIKKLLKQLDEQNQQKLASKTDDSRSPASEKPEEKKPEVKKEEEKVDLSSVQVIPAKIVEKLPDGTYRVKGSQPIMIDQKEFRVIVTGLLKAEDFQDEGISSDKLLEPQFDVVSFRRSSEGIE